MKARWLTFALALLFIGGATLAHGNKVHIKGKIEKIGADSVEVKTPEGKTVEVKLAASTVYLQHVPKPPQGSDANADKPATLADLAVGDAVVIHATPKGSQLEADQIKFSAPSSNRVTAPPAQKPQT